MNPEEQGGPNELATNYICMDIFHDPPNASEPTPDEDTAKLIMPAMITEAECNRRVEDAKREQMEADCDLLSEMACMERRRESQALRGAVTSIRVAWGMEHK